MNGSTSGFESGTPQNLLDWLDGQTSRPEWRMLRGMIASLLDAVEKMHAEKGVHGALSPRTVRIFGSTPPRLRIAAPASVAAMAEPDPEALAYVAPELRGDGGVPTLASDMFALAAVAYRIVTGRPPDLDISDQPLHRTASHLAGDDYPAEFLAAVDTTLAAAPDKRLVIADWRDRALPPPDEEMTVAVVPARPTGPGRAGARQDTSHAAPRGFGRFGTAGVSQLVWGLAAGAALSVLLGTWLLVRIGSAIDLVQMSQLSIRPAGIVEARAPASEALDRPPAPDAPTTVAAIAAAPSPKVNQSSPLRSPFRDCENCPEMVVIEPGTVQMRLTPPNGLRPHELAVTVAGPFAVGRFELTRAEFRAFVEATGFSPPPGCYVRSPEWRLDEHLTWQSPGYSQDDRHPVACLSFEDAKAYVAWLSERTGKRYRLLSDAEWHLIASSPDVPQDRGAGQCRFANGADQTAQAAEPRWIAADCRDGYHYTAPVGSFAATGPGLSDLFGNVWEWVDSCAPDFSGATPVFSECAGDTPRILRGGSWSDRPEMLALDTRILSLPNLRDQIAGVRIARDVSSCETGAKACPPGAGVPRQDPKALSTVVEPAGHVEAVKDPSLPHHRFSLTRSVSATSAASSTMMRTPSRFRSKPSLANLLN